MKLSEAIMLGDVLREREPSTFLESMEGGKFCGCAIGGACLALGDEDARNRAKRWPWIKEIPARYGRDLANTNLSWEDIIGCGEAAEHPSFHKVCRGEVTFEQLVDYVRSIEPECGECCKFECTCPKTAAVTEDEKALVSA